MIPRSIRNLTPASVTLLLIAIVTAAVSAAPDARRAASASAPSVDRAAPMARGFVRPIPDADALDIVIGPRGFADTSAEIAALGAVAVLPAPTATPSPPPPTAVPAAAPPPAPVAAVPLAGVADAELRMLALISASRLAGGLAPLALDGRAFAVARAHSQAEAQVGYVYHDGPDGTASSRNVPACGNGWYGENTGKVWQGNVDALHREFMSEPWAPINHRTNIMDPAFRRIGIGAVQGRDALYMTMVFCR